MNSCYNLLQFSCCILVGLWLTYNMNKRRNNMNDLNCKKCDTPTGNHDNDVVAVTCSLCSMLDVIDTAMTLKGCDSDVVGIA